METFIISQPNNKKANEINENLINANQASSEEALLLRRIIKLMESNAVVDINKRQKINVETITGAGLGTGISGLNAGAGVAVPNSPTANAPQPNANTTYWQNVFVGPVDQRYLIKDQARNTYANSIRSKISF